MVTTLKQSLPRPVPSDDVGSYIPRHLRYHAPALHRRQERDDCHDDGNPGLEDVQWSVYIVRFFM